MCDFLLVFFFMIDGSGWEKTHKTFRILVAMFCIFLQWLVREKETDGLAKKSGGNRS